MVGVTFVTSGCLGPTVTIQHSQGAGGSSVFNPTSTGHPSPGGVVSQGLGTQLGEGPVRGHPGVGHRPLLPSRERVLT